VDNTKGKSISNNNKNLKKASIEEKPLEKNKIAMILIVLLIVRVLLTLLPSHKIDIGFLKWEISYLGNNSLKNFTTDIHFVYGPIYAFFLKMSAIIVKTFSLPDLAQEFMIKIWAVLFDFVAAAFIYLIGKKYNKIRLGIGLAIFYVLNPAIVFNSSVWGQFDGITAALFIGVVYFFNIRRSNIALFIYAVAALTKPQAIALFPLVAILYFKDFPWAKFSNYFKTKDKNIIKPALKSSFIKLGTGFLGCLLIYTVLILPFYKETPFYSMREINIYSKDLQNISSGKQISASSTAEDRFSTNNLTDGKYGVFDGYWASRNTSPQWLVFDLGAPMDVGRVTLNWGFEYAKGYNIQISDDSNKWTTVYSTSKGKGKSESIPLDSARGRYVKIEMEKRPFPYGLINIDENAGAIKKAAFKAIDFYYWLVHHYSSSLDDYPYATANAFNMWTILGKQMVDDRTPSLFGITYGTWGYILLFSLVWLLAALLLLIKRKSALALYYSAFILTAGIFVFASRVHERYLLPAIIMAIVCVFWEKRMWIPTILISAACLTNQWYVYYIQNKNPDAPWLAPDDPVSMVTAWITLLVMIGAIVYLFMLAGKKDVKKQKARTGVRKK